MREHQRVELLTYQLRRLAAQYLPAVAQMRLDLIKHFFYLPAPVVERGEFRGGRSGRVQQIGDQAVQRLGVGHSLEAILDDPHPDAIALMPPVGVTGIDGAPEGPTRPRRLPRKQ